MEEKKEQKIERGDTKLALKAGFWYVLCTFLTKGLAFITAPIFVRLMSPADYGEFSNFANWQSMLLIVAGLELYNTLSRAYYDHKDCFDQYASSITVASCAVSGFFYLLFLLFGNWIYTVVAIPAQYVHILFFTLIFQTCKSVFLTRERTLYHYKSVTLISALSLVIPTLISIAFVMMAPDDLVLSARIYGFYFPCSLIGVFCAGYLLLKGKTFKWKHVRYAIPLAIPLLVHYLTAFLLTSTNTILTKNVLGSEAAATVSVTTSIMNILTILFQSVTGALTTWIMDQLEKKDHLKVRKCTLGFVAIIALISIGIMLVAPELIWIFGGKQYAHATTLIPGLAVAVFFQIITTVLTIILTYNKTIVMTAVFTAIGALISIVAKVLLLPDFGYEVLPVINAIVFPCLFALNYWLIRRTGYTKCIPIKWVGVISVVVVLGMVASFFLYQHTVLRYAVIALIAIAALAVLYKTKNVWMKLLRRKKKAA